MKEAIVISIISEKGGIGKTTTTSCIGSILHLRNYKVLYIDNDPQANLSLSMSIEKVVKYNEMDVLTEKCPAKDAVVKTSQGDLIAGGKGLAQAEKEISGTGREYKLSEAISPIKNEYDFILIDCPPSLGVLTVNAMTASDYIIIPAQADAFSIQGIDQTYETFNLIKKYTNRNLSILGLILTRYNNRTVLSKELRTVIEDVAKKMHCSVLGSVREGIVIKESQAAKTDIMHYAPNCNAALDYISITDTILNKLKDGQ